MMNFEKWIELNGPKKDYPSREPVCRFMDIARRNLQDSHITGISNEQNTCCAKRQKHGNEGKTDQIKDIFDYFRKFSIRESTVSKVQLTYNHLGVQVKSTISIKLQGSKVSFTYQ